MEQQNIPPNDEGSEPTKRRTPAWMRGWKGAVTGVVVLATATAGSWAVSGTPGVRSVDKQVHTVSNRLDKFSASLDRATGDHLDETIRQDTPPADSAPKNTAPKNAVFQQELDNLVTKDGIPGVEAFVRQADGKVRNYTAGVGNLSTKAAVPVDGQVRIASNTKTFTATRVLQLVDEGKIDLNKSVQAYLPGLVHGKGIDGTKITVRDLLQQTSGLPDYASVLVKVKPGNTGLLAVQHTYLSPRQELDAALTKPSLFTPGTKWSYSNTNYLLAGLIVQRVTGRPIGEEITTNVIDKLGLRHTYWPNTGVQAIAGTHSQAYFMAKPGGKPVNVTQLDPSLVWAAGQLISTPSDLSTFNRALLDGKLLKPAQQKELLTTVNAPGFEPASTWSYGLGFATRTLKCGVQAWGHGGDIAGFETRNLSTIDGRSVVIALNALPTNIQGLEHLNAAVEDGICG